MKSLVLFVHGLGGTAKGTWGAFPELIRSDPELSARYDVETFEYPTSLVGKTSSLQKVADTLRTEIEHKYEEKYPSIAIVAHSQGGLIARWLIAERINSGRWEQSRIDRLLTFATPHHGAGGATAFSWLPFISRQTKALDPNSGFMQALALAWAQSDAWQKLAIKYVQAADDWIVGPVSAIGDFPIDAPVVAGVGHKLVVKPDSAKDLSFLVAKRFLLDDSLRPSGVESDWRPPVLRFKQLPQTEVARFIFGARALPFVGRDDELRSIDAFLRDQTAPFRWMLLYGSGGVGKSRLVMELCLAAQEAWHAGFLDERAREPDWTLWRPRAPTLIVIDYAARHVDRAKKIVGALAGRNAGDGDIRRLDMPVRVVLIERTSGGRWLDDVVAADPWVNAARAQELPLKAVADPWPFFEHVLRAANKPMPDKTATLAALGEIDPERRPLFAHFMADAIADGRDIRDFDAERLLDDVIGRARERFWKPLGSGPKEERLLALATIAGGLPRTKIGTVAEPFALAWDIDRHRELFAAMTGLTASDGVPPLEPDIVGEHFALSKLVDENLSDDDRAKFLDAAWTIGPVGTADFSLRAHRDLPTHPKLLCLRRPPTGDWAPVHFWSITVVYLMQDLPARDPPAAMSLLAHMRAVAQERDEPVLWERWAQAAYNLARDLGARDPAVARALIDDMRAVAQQRGESTLWVEWAEAVANLVARLPADDLPSARVLVEGMRAVAQQRDESALWEEWARAATNLIAYLPAHDLAAARRLIDDMCDVAQRRGEPVLWERWAQAAYNLARQLNAFDSATSALVNDMRAVAQQREEPALWVEWAKAAYNLANDLRDHDPPAARCLIDDMRAVAQQRDEPVLWQRWAQAAYNLARDFGVHHPSAARAVVDDICYVAQRRGDPALWELWARAAFNLARELNPLDPATSAIVNDMRAVAQRLGQPALWELWVSAALNLTIGLGTRDPEATRMLVDEMRAVAQQQNEPALWERWAKAACNLEEGLRALDPEAARGLVDDMREVAEKRGEAPLRVLWAMAAIDLANAVQAKNPEGTADLVAQLIPRLTD